ncbi:hypothetical protein B0H66DRAFT_537087 [Apodospora peruviana]|uniref:BZIP domain-containing protein n=1 Tax=Apodospora peruviana TaxID=516989 RepID=A0AAE0LZZ1_9PEZI|nr:hypothetical protein B0H66DRAFT_537087 [Apodospora peruviana]
MSQRGSAPRPASRRSSPSPAKDVVAPSPTSQRSHTRQDDSNAQLTHDPGGPPVTEGDGRRQQLGSRTSGVHNILNPPDPGTLSGSSPSLSRAHIKEESPPHPAMGSGQYGGGGSPSHPYIFHSQGTTTQQQPTNLTIPATSLPPGPPLPLGRGSPTGSHPYPIPAARRILTPRSPRPASLNRAALRTVEPQHITGLPPRIPRSAPPPPHDVSAPSAHHTLGEPYQLSGPTRGSGQAAAPPPTRPGSGLSRSLSQPMISHGLHPTPRQEPLQPPSLGRGLGTLPGVYTPGSSFPSSTPSSGGLTTSGLTGEWRWGSGPLGPAQTAGAGPRGLQMTEGHQHLLITPDHGEKILVPVDTHQGSKQMNEKRQRNAGASARFRHRKKIKDQAMMEEMQKLESQNRDLMRRIDDLERRQQELEAERDFYRDGGRPGEFVPPRFPERVERGPSSPVSSRSVGSYVGEQSPPLAPPLPLPPYSRAHPHPHPYAHAHAHPHAHPHPHPHPSPASYGEPSMLERPARRRRIDSAPELSVLTHGSSPPTPLPPIPPPSYGVPPSPHLTGPPGPPGSARLPPLRFDQPSPSETPPPLLSGTHPPPPPPQPQSQSQPRTPYPPYSRASYEKAGWATEPPRQPEGGQR